MRHRPLPAHPRWMTSTSSSTARKDDDTQRHRQAPLALWILALLELCLVSLVCYYIAQWDGIETGSLSRPDLAGCPVSASDSDIWSAVFRLVVTAVLAGLPWWLAALRPRHRRSLMRLGWLVSAPAWVAAALTLITSGAILDTYCF